MKKFGILSMRSGLAWKNYGVSFMKFEVFKKHIDRIKLTQEREQELSKCIRIFRNTSQNQ